MTHMSEKRRWDDGSTITRQEAEEAGLRWSHVCLYTEPLTAPSEECPHGHDSPSGCGICTGCDA